MTGIYVVSFAYANTTTIPPDGQANTNLSSLLDSTKGDASLEVRVGCFGLCANEGGAFWFCSADSKAMVNQFGSDSDPLNIIWLARQFQRVMPLEVSEILSSPTRLDTSFSMPFLRQTNSLRSTISKFNTADHGDS